MGRVEAEAARMGLLVEDLLTLARIDQQRPLAKAPVDLLTLAADAVQDARIVAPGRPVDLVVAPGTAFIVDGDEPRLRQVISNLVNNALTHTPDDAPIEMRLRTCSAERQAPDGHSAPAGGHGAFAGDEEAVGNHHQPAVNGAAAEIAPVAAVVLEVAESGPGLTPEQAEYIGVPVDGPFKPDYYRY